MFIRTLSFRKVMIYIQFTVPDSNPMQGKQFTLIRGSRFLVHFLLFFTKMQNVPLLQKGKTRASKASLLVIIWTNHIS